jgi:hypothetical protein
MQDMTLLEWIERAETDSGDAYREARAEIAREPEAAIPLLRERAALGPPSQTGTVEMLLAFLTDQPLVQRVDTLMRGAFGAGLPKPITGSWTAADRAAEIVSLGIDALPVVIEALTKTFSYANDVERETLFEALRLWRSDRAVGPLVLLLGLSLDPVARLLAVHTLGRLRAVEVWPVLTAVAGDPREDRRLRLEAIRAIGWARATAAHDGLCVLAAAADSADVRELAATVAADLAGRAEAHTH